MKNRLLTYFKEKILHRPLKTDDVIYTLKEGKLEGVYTDTMTFSDLLITDNGFQFNMTTATQEKIYLLDAEKKRIAVEKDYTGTSVFRYELATRKSTGEITGYMRGLSTSVPNQTMEAVVYGVFDVRLENEQVKWKEQQLLYRDLPFDEGKYRPVAFDPEVRFFLEEDKLRFEYIPKLYDVNPKSLTKTLSEVQYPRFLSKEI